VVEPINPDLSIANADGIPNPGVCNAGSGKTLTTNVSNNDSYLAKVVNRSLSFKHKKILKDGSQ
jgi:hypothetical protein